MIKYYCYRFVSLKGYLQIFIFILVSIFMVALFAFLFGFETSIKVFLDPGNFDASVGNMLLIELVLLLSGILLSGMIIGTIVNGFERLSKDAELYDAHQIIKESFDIISSIQIRKLLIKLDINSKRRLLDLQDAEIRLELTKEDIVNSIKKFGQLRLKMLKNSKDVVIEAFDANTEYGCLINNQSNLTFISTQNYSDIGIGHFTSTLAHNLNANYISNEFYSTGAPLKSQHIDFANNDAYQKFSDQSKFDVINIFKSDLKELAKSSSLMIYMGTSNDLRPNHIHVLFGGELGDTNVAVKNPIYHDSKKLELGLEKLKIELAELSFKMATHEEFSNINPKHLSQGIHKESGVNILTIYVSTQILWSDKDADYYKVMKKLRDFIAFVN